LQSLTTVSLWAPQFIARQQPFVVDFIVPQADDGFPELPARYPTLNFPFDVLGTLAQLAR